LSSAIRALADSGQTRVWNLLIDLIVQTAPRFQTQASPTHWEPTAQERVWLHVSLDRFTGRVLDTQWERVDE
jgi:hypothetical protein